MSTTAISARPLVVAVNWPGVQEMLARRFGRVPEMARRYMDELERTAAAGPGEPELHTLIGEAHLDFPLGGDDWDLDYPLWHAADFEREEFAQALRDARRMIADDLRTAYGRACDIWIFDGGDPALADPVLALVLEMLIEDSADPRREITIVRLPGAASISDRRFREVDAVADLGLFTGLDFSEPPAENGKGSAEGTGERPITEIKADGGVGIVVEFSGLPDEDEEE